MQSNASQTSNNECKLWIHYRKTMCHEAQWTEFNYIFLTTTITAMCFRKSPECQQNFVWNNTPDSDSNISITAWWTALNPCRNSLYIESIHSLFPLSQVWTLNRIQCCLLSVSLDSNQILLCCIAGCLVILNFLVARYYHDVPPWGAAISPLAASHFNPPHFSSVLQLWAAFYLINGFVFRAFGWVTLAFFYSVTCQLCFHGNHEGIGARPEQDPDLPFSFFNLNLFSSSLFSCGSWLFKHFWWWTPTEGRRVSSTYK